ncbi:uncharacterized protein THITE_2116229, partial [Thermothielavioides terrestris NRRL 8126]
MAAEMNDIPPPPCSPERDLPICPMLLPCLHAVAAKEYPILTCRGDGRDMALYLLWVPQPEQVQLSPQEQLSPHMVMDVLVL